MGFVVVYHPCGLLFRKGVKIDFENWGADHCRKNHSLGSPVYNSLAPETHDRVENPWFCD